MKINDIPKHVLVDLQEGADLSNEAIELMEPKEVFEKWLEWNGIIGWADNIWDTIEALKTSERKLQDPAMRFTELHKDCKHETVYFNRAERKVICRACYRELPELTAQALAKGPKS